MISTSVAALFPHTEPECSDSGVSLGRENKINFSLILHASWTYTRNCQFLQSLLKILFYLCLVAYLGDANKYFFRSYSKDKLRPDKRNNFAELHHWYHTLGTSTLYLSRKSVYSTRQITKLEENSAFRCQHDRNFWKSAVFN